MNNKVTKKRSKKTGLPPGSLVHIGEKTTGDPRITVLHYDEAGVDETTSASLDTCFLLKDSPGVTWINVDRIDRVEIIEKLGECYGFHPLVLEDIVNTHQRPKLEDYGEYLYIVLKGLQYKEGTQRIETEQLSLILGKNYLFSFEEGKETEFFAPIRERIRAGKGRLRKEGPDALAYTLLDVVVDHYFDVMEALGDRVELLEGALVEHPEPKTLREIQVLKREMIALRKAVWPLREVIGRMERGESPMVREGTKIYLRDVYDHTIQVMDAVDTFRDMLSGMLDIYLSSVSNRLNAVMKVLTIIATLFMPLTFIAGLYGMNFKYMPELEWHWGYPAVLSGMGLIVIGMLIYFRKKRWL
jgi:magnesium transporter